MQPSRIEPAPAGAKPVVMVPGQSPMLPAVPPRFFPIDGNQPEKEGPCTPPLEIRLGPGYTIRGRVIDTRERPIAGARVTAELGGCGGLLAWQARTDADGRFYWDHAPTDDLCLNVEDPAQNGWSIWRFAPRPGDGEYVVVFPVPFRLRGKVTDAATGRPIERFRLVEGVVWTHDFAPDDYIRPPDWSEGRVETIVGGQYEVRFSRPKRPDDAPIDYPLLVIRIEAEGYAPAVSRQYGTGEGEQTGDFALRPQPWIQGTVRATDGSPDAGATVVVAVRGGPMPRIGNGRPLPGWSGDAVRTGPDGRYGFPRPDAGGRVVIVGDRGLAQRTVEELAAAPDVTLEPWGRIVGQLRVGAGVGVRRIVGAELIEFDHRGAPEVPIRARALTDADGRFVLDRVAPGRTMLYRPYWPADGPWYRSHRQGVDVTAGRIAEVIVGGAGRPVVGRLTRAEGLPPFDFAGVVGFLEFMQPDPEFPEGFDEWDAAQKRSWWWAYYRTEEGRRYYEARNGYLVKVQPDGSFRIDDVPGGTYRLRFEATTPPTSEAGPEDRPTRVAELRLDIDVPVGPDDKPMDLGTLTLTPPGVNR